MSEGVYRVKGFGTITQTAKKVLIGSQQDTKRVKEMFDLRNVTKICMLATLVLAFSLSGATGQLGFGQFGSKVVSGDMDEGHLLAQFALPGQTPIHVGFWDIGTTRGVPDEGDVIYLHFGPPAGPVAVNDIRLTPFGIYGAGSKVTAADNDLGKGIIPLAGAQIRFADVGGVIGLYDSMDTVYITRSPPALTKTGDIRLTSAGAFPAGSVVRDFDPDNNHPVVFLAPIPLGIVASPTIRFYNKNGNVGLPPPLLPIYDAPDDVYLSFSPAPPPLFGFVTPNDIRLSN